jgi:hypothetical protein
LLVRGWGRRATRVCVAFVVLAFLSLVGADTALADASDMEKCVAVAHTRGEGHFEQLDDAQISELLGSVEESLAQQRLGASLWYAGWSAFNVTNVAVGVWKGTAVDTRLERDTWLMSSIGAGLFVLGAVVMPPPGLYANLRLSRLPARTPEQRRAKLRQGLLLLERAAVGEDRNSNLTAHLFGVGYALFSTLYIYFRNPHSPRGELYLAAGLQLLFSVVGAEATLWSVPRKARRDLAGIRPRACGEKAQTRAVARSLGLSASLAGLGLQLKF